MEDTIEMGVIKAFYIDNEYVENISEKFNIPMSTVMKIIFDDIDNDDALFNIVKEEYYGRT